MACRGFVCVAVLLAATAADLESDCEADLIGLSKGPATHQASRTGQALLQVGTSSKLQAVQAIQAVEAVQAAGPFRVSSGACAIDAAGCVTSPAWPAWFPKGSPCEVEVLRQVRVYATAFDMGPADRNVILRGVVYFHTTGPHGVTLPAGASFAFSNSCPTKPNGPGFRICPEEALTSAERSAEAAFFPPATGPTGRLQITEGPCSVDAGGCAVSPGFPEPYEAKQSCKIAVTGSLKVSAAYFDTEATDVLTINGQGYSGGKAPVDVLAQGNIKWKSDGAINRAGWRLCPVA